MNGRGNGKGGKERGRERGDGREKGRGAYQDEDPLTKVLNTPLKSCSFKALVCHVAF